MTFPILFQADTQWAQPTIYGLVDPREPDRIRYVGQSLCAASRYASHIKPSNGSRSLRDRWIAVLLADGIFAAMVLLERPTAADLDSCEATWIANLKAVGQADLNGRRPDHKTVKGRHWTHKRRGYHALAKVIGW